MDITISISFAFVFLLRYGGSSPELTGNHLIVNVKNESKHKISPLLYGIFFEEINFAGEGGIYGELIRNRDFETQGRGNVGAEFNFSFFSKYGKNQPDQKAIPPVLSDYRPWYFVGQTESKAMIATINTTSPFSSNPVSMKLTINSSNIDSIAGIANPGYWGIDVRENNNYKLSFYAKTNKEHAKVMVSLGMPTPDKMHWETVSSVKEILLHGGSDWTKYTTELIANVTYTKAHFYLTTSYIGEFWFDSISLFSGDAQAGLFRKDIFDMLHDLHPRFMRFPGGNYLEGNTQATRYAWKQSINNPAARSGHYNDAWGYWSADGLGLHEYLVLSEELGALPQLSIYTGYSMRTGYVPINESQTFVQDALDALEYANGDANTKYGAMRIANGHPEPFNLTRLEVGNEEKNHE